MKTGLRVRSTIIQDIDLVEAKKHLDQGAKALNLDLSDQQLEQFMIYLDLLRKWNRVVNLTALLSPREIIVKHFLDSLTLLPYLPREARVLDLGSGAGFPGLPIKIARPGQRVTLMEASAKKVSFLKETIRQLKVLDTSVVQGYLGKGAPPWLGADPIEIITIRAVGRLQELLSGIFPYLPWGGQIVLMKGRPGLQEVVASESEIYKKGFQIESPIVLNLPFLDQERIILFLTKTKEMG